MSAISFYPPLSFVQRSLILFIILMISTSTSFAAVKAYLEQTSVYDGDPVSLTIETSINNNAKPNLEPLQKDFTILGRSTSSQINILNGQRSFKKSWVIQLQPKKKGKLQIPEISIGNDKTKALQLNIIDLPPEISAQTSKHILVESSVDISGNDTYVQQQIPYTVRLFYDSAMQSGEINYPKIKNAVIEQLGEDKRYKTIRAGKQFNVLEKHYVISPEKSGMLHIPETIVKGRIALSEDSAKQAPRQRNNKTDIFNRFFNFRNDPFFNNDPFDDFFSQRSRGPSKPFSARSKAIDVNVLPVPKAFTGSSWLPAEELIIKDSWSTNPPELRVGEPVTRTLTLQAKGLAGSQIPEIEIPKPVGMKIYPELAKSVTQTDGSTVYGIQQIDISYIPSKTGNVVIPEIKVDWWNVKTKKQQTFTLPEWNLSIASSPQNTTNTGNPESEIELKTNSKPSATPRNESSKQPDLEAVSSWKIPAISIISLLLISALFVYFFIKRAAKNTTLTPKNKNIDIRSVRSSLLNACNANDNKTAAKLLLQMAQAQWNDPSVHNLGILASRLKNGATIIMDLEKSLYAADSQGWNGKALKALIEEGLQQQETKSVTTHSDDLAPLYPF